MPKLTQTKFAEAVGVAQPTVANYIRDGRLKKAIVHVKGKKRPLIDLEIGRAELANNLDPSRKSKAKVSRKTMLDAIESAGLDPSCVDYQTSRALNEHYKAALNKLEFEERKGTLVKKKDVEKEAFECARMVRDSIMNIPNRIADQLSVISDKKEIRDVLKKELSTALESLSNGI